MNRNYKNKTKLFLFMFFMLISSKTFGQTQTTSTIENTKIKNSNEEFRIDSLNTARDKELELLLYKFMVTQMEMQMSSGKERRDLKRKLKMLNKEKENIYKKYKILKLRIAPEQNIKNR
ncbi:MAG: hypothetical protein ACOX7D_03025 [Alphaproteobacteria bacterium]|jgi:transcriptional regulator with AAA-type ATPase domain|nr:hypothetical protein [Alphaproteobacteria bacterium]